MIGVDIAQVATDVAGRVLADPAKDLVTAVTIDSRGLVGGELFVALNGERVDGHDYAAAALQAGAAAVLIENEDKALATGADPARLILVDSTQDALGALAKAHLARVRAAGNPLVVGVTGSVGKTTTKDLLAKLLAPRGPIIAPPGSFNNEIGLPLTVLRSDEQTATLVLEMGADHVGNLEYLTDIAPLDIGVVLAVAQAHVGEFGGIDNVAKAKAELVAGILPGGTAILNADDHRVAAMADKAETVLTFSTSAGDAVAEDIEVTDGHPSFTLVHAGQRARLSLGLVGVHHVSNALAAASVGLVAGMQVSEVAALLADVAPASPHRMDVWSAKNLTVIDDAYNANPASMRAGIAALSQLGQGRKIAALGAMLELGDESDHEHRSLGQVLAEAGVDTLIAVGAPALAEGARAQGIEVLEASDAEAAWDIVEPLTSAEGTILVKGSNGSRMWALADRLKEALC